MTKKILLLCFLLMCNYIFAVEELVDKDTFDKYTQAWGMKTGRKVNEDLLYDYFKAWKESNMEEVKTIINKIKREECLDYMLCIFSFEELGEYEGSVYLAGPFYDRYIKEIPKKDYNEKFMSLLQDPNISNYAFKCISASTFNWASKENIGEIVNILFLVFVNNEKSESMRISASDGIGDVVFSLFREIAIKATKNMKNAEGEFQIWTKLQHDELINLIIQTEENHTYEEIKSISERHLGYIHKYLKDGNEKQLFYESLYPIIFNYSYIIGRNEIIKQFHLYIKPESNLSMGVRLGFARILCNSLDAKEIIPDVEQLIAEWEKQYAEVKNKGVFYNQKSDIRYLKEYIKAGKTNP